MADGDDSSRGRDAERAGGEDGPGDVEYGESHDHGAGDDVGLSPLVKLLLTLAGLVVLAVLAVDLLEIAAQL